MRKIYAIVTVVLVVISSSVLLINNEESTATSDPYSFTYGDYTVTQGNASKDGSIITVEYTLQGDNVNGSYKVKYGIDSNGLMNTQISDNYISDVKGDAILIPPKVVVSDQEEHNLSALLSPGASAQPQLSGTKVLIISTEGASLSMGSTATLIKMNDLESLVVDSVLTGTASNFINMCPKLSEVYVKEIGSTSNGGNSGNFWNLGTTLSMSKIDISFKTSSSTIFKQINGSPGDIPITVKLLSGSVKASSMKFTNVGTVLLDAADWDADVSLTDIGVVAGTPAIEFYGSIPASATYNVGIADGQAGVAVDKESAAENEVVTVTISPPQGKQVASVSVIDANSTPVQATVDQQNQNVYTFNMPASGVTVSAAFENVPSVSITPAVSNVAKGSSTNVTVSADNLKNVSSLYITLTYDTTMFELKSPAYSNLLNSAVLKGDVTKGEYVVAFSEPQNITGDLFTFQLEAKDDATVGAYAISCVVDINGTVNNGVNQPEASYNDSSELTIGNMRGDLDSDGDVDEDDAVYLLLYTFRASTHPLPEGQNVDYNNDGVVNSDDAIYLKNYLTNPAQYPLSGGA